MSNVSLDLTNDETMQLGLHITVANVGRDSATIRAWMVRALLIGARKLAEESPGAEGRLDAMLSDLRIGQAGDILRETAHAVPQATIPDRPLPHERQAEVRRNYEQSALVRQYRATGGDGVLTPGEINEINAATLAEINAGRSQATADRARDPDDVMSMINTRRAARNTDVTQAQLEAQSIAQRLSDMNRITDTILNRLRHNDIQFPAYRTADVSMPGVAPNMSIPPSCDNHHGGRLLQFGYQYAASVQPAHLGKHGGANRFAWVCQLTQAGRRIGNYHRQCATEQDLKRWFADVVTEFEYVPVVERQTFNPHYRGDPDPADTPEPSTSLTRRERVIDLLGE